LYLKKNVLEKNEERYLYNIFGSLINSNIESFPKVIKMAEVKTPKFTSAIVYAAIIIGIMITVLILHTILWQVTGWTPNAKFAFEEAIMVGWGIVFPAVLIVVAIVGSKIYEKSEYIPLIFGIIITAMGGILILISGLYIYTSISDTITWVPSLPQTAGIYITLIIFSFVGLALSILILLGGIKHITYYTSRA
jgi:hypothetical protein